MHRGVGANIYTYIIEGKLIRKYLARKLPVLGEGDGARDGVCNVLRDAVASLAVGPRSGSTYIRTNVGEGRLIYIRISGNEG